MSKTIIIGKQDAAKYTITSIGPNSNDEATSIEKICKEVLAKFYDDCRKDGLTTLTNSRNQNEQKI